MESGDRSVLLSRRPRKVATGAAAIFLLAVAAGAADLVPIGILGVKNPLLETAATRATALALEKLAHPRCQRIFEDFRDGRGRTLAERLADLGQTGDGFLRTLRFANGERFGPCQMRNVLAATEPNSHVIFLCGFQFFERQHRDPELAAHLVIHEMLHSLGLGENPPSSVEITSRVAERCGQ